MPQLLKKFCRNLHFSKNIVATKNLNKKFFELQTVAEMKKKTFVENAT